MRARIFNLMQYELHPITKEPLISEAKIKDALAHKSIKRWAYIAHNRDVYSEKDEREDKDGLKKAGEVKPLHFHVVIEADNAIEVSAVARWFGISENFVDVPKGHGAFLDCVEYLTHEDDKQQEQNKILYSDDEIKANFDFRDALIKRSELKARYGKELNSYDQLLIDVQNYGLTLRQAEAKEPLIYAKNKNTIKSARQTYLSNQKPPLTRMNFYVCGGGGEGKGLFSKALARSLFPGLDDKDCFFETGSKGSIFDGYDGQPVVIWNDWRAGEIISCLGGRGNVFALLDTHPGNVKMNVKYSYAEMINKVNIINGVQSYEDFLDSLAGEYETSNGTKYEAEDKNQSYRRFPMIVLVRADDYDFLINKGYLGEGTYQQYFEHKKIESGLRRIHELCSGREELLRELETKVVEPLKLSYDVIMNEQQTKSTKYTDDEIRKHFENVGRRVRTEDELLEAAAIDDYNQTHDADGNEIDFESLPDASDLTEEELREIAIEDDENKPSIKKKLFGDYADEVKDIDLNDVDW